MAISSVTTAYEGAGLIDDSNNAFKHYQWPKAITGGNTYGSLNYY